MPTEPSADLPTSVHGLLVCRGVVPLEDGSINLEQVLEIAVVDQLPGDAGPLTFIAFVRNPPIGKADVAFLIYPAGSRDHLVSRIPLDVDVPAAFAGRQIIVHIRVPSIPVERGGWFDVALDWDGRELAVNRFAIGARSDLDDSSSA